MRYGDDSRYIVYDGIKHEIDYQSSKGYVHAYVRIHGKQIIGVDTTMELAFYNLQNHMYQEFDYPKEKFE